MDIKTSADYNPCQINETINFSLDGKVISKSLMLNLRGETVQNVWKAYRELRKLVGSEESISKGSEIKIQTCSCGSPMILRTGRLGPFFGCSSYPSCKITKSFEVEKKQEEETLKTIQV